MSHCCLMQTGAHHALRPLLMPAVWLMALLSGGVAVASCVVNDYFDMRSDTINAPHKVARATWVLASESQACADPWTPPRSPSRAAWSRRTAHCSSLRPSTCLS